MALTARECRTSPTPHRSRRVLSITLRSKEALGAAALDRYWQLTERGLQVLSDEGTAPLERLNPISSHSPTDAELGLHERMHGRNFGTELADHSRLIRDRLAMILQHGREQSKAASAKRSCGAIETDLMLRRWPLFAQFLGRRCTAIQDRQRWESPAAVFCRSCSRPSLGRGEPPAGMNNERIRLAILARCRTPRCAAIAQACDGFVLLSPATRVRSGMHPGEWSRACSA